MIQCEIINQKSSIENDINVYWTGSVCVL